MGNHKNCQECDTVSQLRTTIHNYNLLVKEHNKLVDEHQELYQNSAALVKYLQDIAMGLRVQLVNDVPFLQLQELSPVPVESLPAFNVDKRNTAELHNDIVAMLNGIKGGAPFHKLYAAWIEDCMRVAQDMEIASSSGIIIAGPKGGNIR